MNAAPSKCTMAFYLGQTVRRLRQERQMSQQDLANKCELDRSYITLIEKGRKNPTLNIVEKIGSAVADSSAHFMAIVAYDTHQTCSRFCEQGGCPVKAGAMRSADCPTKKAAGAIAGVFTNEGAQSMGGLIPES